MLPRLRGGRGRGNNCGRITKVIDIGQPHRNPLDHPEGMDDVSFSGREHIDSTSGDIALGVYPAAPPP